MYTKIANETNLYSTQSTTKCINTSSRKTKLLMIRMKIQMGTLLKCTILQIVVRKKLCMRNCGRNPRNRYKKLCRYIYIANSDTITDDKIGKIRTIMDTVRND